jgi:hypothetical protein
MSNGHYYAITALRSGVYHFTSEAERDVWLAEQGEYGEAVPSHRVAASIRMEFEDSTVRDPNGTTLGLFPR